MRFIEIWLWIIRVSENLTHAACNFSTCNEGVQRNVITHSGGIWSSICACEFLYANWGFTLYHYVKWGQTKILLCLWGFQNLDHAYWGLKNLAHVLGGLVNLITNNGGLLILHYAYGLLTMELDVQLRVIEIFCILIS